MKWLLRGDFTSFISLFFGPTLYVDEGEARAQLFGYSPDLISLHIFEDQAMKNQNMDVPSKAFQL